MRTSDGVRRTVTFTVIAVLLACVVAFTFQAFGGRIGRGALFGVMSFFYMWIPALTAIALQRWVYREGVIGPLGVSFKINRWWLAALALPLLAVYLAFAISLVMPDVSLIPNMAQALDKYRAMIPADRFQQARQKLETFPPYFRWLALFLAAVPGMIVGGTVNAVAGFGEELGWRGFLQKALAHLGFWKSSFIIGIIWGLWHAPLVIQGANYPQHRISGILIMTLLCILLAPIFAYVRLRGKSVVAAAIAHGTGNATAELSTLLISGGNDLTVGITGLAGMIALALINLGIFLSDRNISADAGYNAASLPERTAET